MSIKLEYPVSSSKDAWTHVPSGGTANERMDKEPNVQPEVPPLTSYDETNAALSFTTVFCELVKGTKITKIRFWVYCATATGAPLILQPLHGSTEVGTPFEVPGGATGWFSAVWAIAGELTTEEGVGIRFKNETKTAGTKIYALYAEYELPSGAVETMSMMV